MTDVVVARGLVRQFSAGDQTVRAVDGVDLTVAAGELLMVLGRSGAGKTTLLSLVGALDRPDSGTVIVAGHTVQSLSGRDRDTFLQRSVGWVFQTSGLIPLLTAAENVDLALHLAGVPRDELEHRAQAALVMVGLGDRREHTAAELSGGEQQRVAVARALAKRPTVVIADEPTAQLDSETAAGIMRLLRDVAAQGTAVLMATHDRVAVEFADRVATMEDGRLA
ncbi:MAG TPA: ABC transporter ATP-binding protein [Solirubrobacteraceae bacterium]|nr:ABC transporter ATP-binding protein [Solirubrobacteraceae bacterium]